MSLLAVRRAYETATIDLSDVALVVGGTLIVSAWELPVQRALAQFAEPTGHDVLEIGFGLGMCARRIAELRPRTHVIVEAHPTLAAFAKAIPTAQVIRAFWEELSDRVPARAFDALVFDAYPLSLDVFDGSLHANREYAIASLPAFTRYLSPHGKGTIIDFSMQLGKDRALNHAALAAGLQFDAFGVDVSIPSECQYASGSAASVLVFSRRHA